MYPKQGCNSTPKLISTKPRCYKKVLNRASVQFTLFHLHPIIPSDGIQANVTTVVEWPDEIKAREVVVGKNKNWCLLIIVRRYPPKLLEHSDGNRMIVRLRWCNIKVAPWNFLFAYEKKELKSASVSHMQSYTGSLNFLHQKNRKRNYRYSVSLCNVKWFCQ